MIPGVFFTNIFFVTFNYLTPVWSQQILRKGAEGYSLMELGLATGFFIGAFMGCRAVKESVCKIWANVGVFNRGAADAFSGI